MEKQTKKTAPAAPKRDEEPVTNSRGLATQDKILEAAKTLLLKEGATKLTVSAVAKKAGVSASAAVRVSGRLGFESFAQFKRLFRLS